MGAGDCDLSEQFVLERTINVIQNGVKGEKIKSLKELKKLVNDCEDNDRLKQLFDKIGPTLLRTFQDPNEGCRELALSIVKELLDRLPKDKLILQQLMPIFYSRICCDTNLESSEELKLFYSNLLIFLIKKYERDLAPYLEEIIPIMVKLLSEPAPEIKKAMSLCVMSLVDRLPAEAFSLTKKLVAPLVYNIGHQHWRVRVATIKALEELMLKGDNKCVPDIVNPVTKCLFDDSHHVRLSVTKLAGHWLQNLFDRYSFFSSLIPIILTSLVDENEEIRIEANNLWEKAGRQYLLENEKDYKDRMDYEPIALEHYPKGVKRPGLGCRILIEQEGSKFILALANELGDWNERVRIMSSLLLVQYALHAEASLTQSLHKIINAMCRGAMDRETPKVVANVKLAAEYMGYFVPPDIYCKLIVTHLKEANLGELNVVAGLIKGSKGSELQQHLPEVVNLLMNTTFKGEEQDALLNLIENLFSTCGKGSLDIGEQIWAALISTAGLAAGDLIRTKALKLLDDFVIFEGGERKSVYNKYCRLLFDSLLDVVWTAHCHQQFILASVIENAGEVIGSNLQLIVTILQGAMSASNDPEVILKVTIAVNSLLSRQEITLPTPELVSVFVKLVLKDLLLPHLKWKPGRSAEAIRTVASTCLYMCLLNITKTGKTPSRKTSSGTEEIEGKSETKPNEANSEANSSTVISMGPDSIVKVVKTKTESAELEEILARDALENDDDVELLITENSNQEVDLKTVIPVVVSLLEDAAAKTRLMSLNCVNLLVVTEEANETEQFYNLVTSVLKRLEDADKKVREQALISLRILYEEHVKREDNSHINKGLLEFVYSSLLIHLDDQEKTFRVSVLNCLKSVGKIDSILLRNKTHIEKFRDTEICEELLRFIENYLSNTAN